MRLSPRCRSCAYLLRGPSPLDPEADSRPFESLSCRSRARSQARAHIPAVGMKSSAHNTMRVIRRSIRERQHAQSAWRNCTKQITISTSGFWHACDSSSMHAPVAEACLAPSPTALRFQRRNQSKIKLVWKFKIEKIFSFVSSGSSPVPRCASVSYETQRSLTCRRHVDLSTCLGRVRSDPIS